MSKSLYTTIIEETAPLSTTVGVVGQLYLDSSTKILYQCVAINIEDLTYEWKQISGSSGPTQEDFDKLVNNEVQIEGNNSFLAGGVKFTSGNMQVGIGKDASVYSGGVAIGANSFGNIYSVAVGYGAEAKGAGYNTALGRLAVVNSSKSSIQLGQGTNQTGNTLQVFSDNIYNFSTHTLTVQNIELNSVDLGETLNEITPKVMRALLTPVSAPTKTELVAVDDGNAQTMIEIGEGLSLENGVLKATGASDSGEYVTTKKKILAKNNFGLSFPITLSEAVQSGDIIEIRSSSSIYRVMVSSFPQSIDTSDLEAVEGSSSYNTAVFRGKIQISADGTQITSTLASLYWLNIPTSGNVTVNSTDAAINKVYEVAKIIE